MKERSSSSENYRFGFNTQEKTPEIGEDTYTAEFWQYDSRIARRWNVDPVEKEWESSYLTFAGNPIYFVDIAGNNASTHTDSLGNVVAVYNDGDLGVYKHDNLPKEFGKNDTEVKGGKKRLENNPDEKMGETFYWNQFLYHRTGNFVNEYGVGMRILYSESWDGEFEKIKKLAKDMGLRERAANSTNGKPFSVQDTYPGVAKLFLGKYISSEDMGNYVAGYNASSGTFYINGIDTKVGTTYNMFQRVAGGLHQVTERAAKQNGKASLTTHGKIALALGLKTEGEYPLYGEVIQQYRMSRMGWDDALRDKLKREKKKRNAAAVTITSGF